MNSLFNTGADHNKIFPKLDVLFTASMEMEELLTEKSVDAQRLELFIGYEQPKSMKPEDLYA